MPVCALSKGHSVVVVLLIGERPGLATAESLSAYMAYRPKAGDTDADRDVVSNIFAHGGTDPLAGAASIMQLVQKMMQYQSSGVKLKLAAPQQTSEILH